MRKLENHARFDARKTVIGGILAWLIQALVVFCYRLP